MTTQFTWDIAQLERNVSDGVVFTAHYTIEAFDGTYRSSAYGSIGLDAPDAETMIPYADISKEAVISWVQEKLGGEEKVLEIEAALQSQLAEQKAPSKAAGVPWTA